MQNQKIFMSAYPNTKLEFVKQIWDKAFIHI